MKVKYKGIVFDLDGTLVDTIEDIAASMNRALDCHGFPGHTPDQYKEKVGWGIKRLAFLSLPENARSEETAARVAADSARFYSETPLVHTRPYPGIPELLGELVRKKIKLVVLTNKPDPVAQKVVAGLFPSGTFSSVRGEVAGKPRKPDPACVWELLVELDITPADVIFTGDSEIDIKTALACGSFPLGVSWGYRPRATIEEAGARQIIDRPGELLDFF
ncbi:MAG: HAD family hydrolase [Treponema sp.]|nr:HAD family hydrolase [Treponema sp.]